MRFLVTGATGFIGSHVTDLILARGDEAVCPVRNPSALRHLTGTRAEVAPMNMLEDRALNGSRFDYVIHVAGGTRSIDYESFRRANVELTRRLLMLFATPQLASDLKRFLLVSSQGAAGPSPDGRTPVKESDPPRPVSMYGRSKLEAEEVALTFKEQIPLTIVRPATVFGPRDVDTLGVFKSPRYRVAAFLAGPDRLVSIIHVEDLADGILHAALSPASVGQTYFLANSTPVVWREFALETARILGYRVLPLPIPLHLARLVGHIGDLLTRFGKSPMLFRSDKFQDMKQLAWVCSPEKVWRELNWQCRIPLETAIEKTAAWYRDHGWI